MLECGRCSTSGMLEVTTRFKHDAVKKMTMQSGGSIALYALRKPYARPT